MTREEDARVILAALGMPERQHVHRIRILSAFPDFRTFKKYAQDIAWETEVWIASAADHLLHYNGDRFFGPR